MGLDSYSFVLCVTLSLLAVYAPHSFSFVFTGSDFALFIAFSFRYCFPIFIVVIFIYFLQFVDVLLFNFI